MPDDTAEACCAAGICCNPAKRRAKLAHLIRAHVSHISEAEATAIADYLHATFTLLPKSLGFEAPFYELADMARLHPYE